MTWVATILAAIVGVVKGWFGKKAEPAPTAAEATAKAELAQEKKNNEVLTQAARDRIDTDASVVQALSPDDATVNTEANDRIADKFPGLFRD